MRIYTITIVLIFFVGIFLIISATNVVESQVLNGTKLLANLTEDNKGWRSSAHTNITLANANLTIAVTTNESQKLFNSASLQTQVNSSNTIPPILRFDYSSKDLSYSSSSKPVYLMEIRDGDGSKVLWTVPLNDTSGKAISESVLMPKNVLNRPIVFKLYIITQGDHSSSILTLKNIHVNGFEASSNQEPIIADPTIKAEVFFKGLKFPTNMAFVGTNDLLVLEKNNGTVQRIVNGTLLPKPVLDVNVAIQSERGMEGIAVTKNPSVNKTYVFLYYTETKSRDGQKGSYYNDLGNRLYRYELDENKLVNRKRLLDLPSRPCCIHNGGEIIIGPDNNVYTVIGDTNGHKTKAQNYKNGKNPDGTSAIYRITQNGKTVEPNILGDKKPLNKYFAYGIRNSFGMDFDPLTGNLWNTENGPGSGDEINLVKPGFNSGWAKVQGIWNTNSSDTNFLLDDTLSSNKSLVDFGGKGKYSPPEFTWSMGGVGVTDIKFFNSSLFGQHNENDMFVGDYHNGYLYHFDLSENREELLLDGPLHDKVAGGIIELQSAVFGSGFGSITDIEVSPDGYLYILAYEGTIFRLVPSPS